MKLKALEIQGFRSFIGQQRFDVSALQPGLYLVAGDNKLEPALEGNGAGKSSLFEALYWAMQGKTSRNLKAGSVRSWTGGSCRVAAEFEEGTVERTWGPNSLKWQGRDVDQDTLEQALVTSDVALSTFYFAQFSPFFLDLGPTARMEIYSNVLGLDLWEQKSDQAKALAREAETEAQKIEVQRARIEATADAFEKASFTADIAAWDAQHRAEVSDARRALKDAEAAHAETVEKHESALRELSKVKTAAAEHSRKLRALQATVDEVQEGVYAEMNKQARLEAAVGSAQQSLAQFKRLKEGECPECGQALTPGHLKKHARDLQSRLDAALEKSAHQRPVLRAAQARLEKAKVAVDEYRIRAPATEAAAQRVLGADELMNNAASSVTSLKWNLERLLKETNPFKERAEANKRGLAEARKQLAEATKELADTRAVQASFEFWIKGFKEVRFQVIQESLAQLNAEANECLHAFGLEGWALQFTVEKETKSGTVKRGFLCNVLSPYTDEGVPWEAWSGGESQRLRLAAQLGVANLLCSRLGMEIDFEFWDESTTWLPKQGVEAFLTALQERAHRYQKRIFLADHHAFDFPFDGVLVVEKGEEGSIIKEIA